MKKVIIIGFLLVTGFFVFQQYNQTLNNGEFEDEEAEYTYEGELPAIPESCKNLAKDFENAYYGARSGDNSHSQQVFAFRKFKSCLRDEGFSDDEIEATLAEAQRNARRKLEQDGYGE